MRLPQGLIFFIFWIFKSLLSNLYFNRFLSCAHPVVKTLLRSRKAPLLFNFFSSLTISCSLITFNCVSSAFLSQDLIYAPPSLNVHLLKLLPTYLPHFLANSEDLKKKKVKNKPLVNSDLAHITTRFLTLV